MDLPSVFRDKLLDFSKSLSCCICLSLFEDPHMLPCNHALCKDCTLQLLSRGGACPLCKVPVSRRALRPDAHLRELTAAFSSCLQLFGEEGALMACPAPYVPAPITLEPGFVPPPTRPPRLSQDTAVYSTFARENMGDCCEGVRALGKKVLKHGASSAAQEAKRTSIVGPLVVEDTTNTQRRARQKDTVQPLLRHKRIRGREAVINEEANALECEELPDPVPTGELSSSTETRKEELALSMGDYVWVEHRTWPGMNKHGGYAWIKKIHEDATCDVYYPVEQRREKKVPKQFIRPANIDLNAKTSPIKSRVAGPHTGCLRPDPSLRSVRVARRNGHQAVDYKEVESQDHWSLMRTIPVSGDACARSIEEAVPVVDDASAQNKEDSCKEGALPQHTALSQTENAYEKQAVAPFKKQISLPDVFSFWSQSGPPPGAASPVGSKPSLFRQSPLHIHLAQQNGPDAGVSRKIGAGTRGARKACVPISPMVEVHAPPDNSPFSPEKMPNNSGLTIKSSSHDIDPCNLSSDNTNTLSHNDHMQCTETLQDAEKECTNLAENEFVQHVSFEQEFESPAVSDGFECNEILEDVGIPTAVGAVKMDSHFECDEIIEAVDIPAAAGAVKMGSRLSVSTHAFQADFLKCSENTHRNTEQTSLVPNTTFKEQTAGDGEYFQCAEILDEIEVESPKQGMVVADNNPPHHPSAELEVELSECLETLEEMEEAQERPVPEGVCRENMSKNSHFETEYSNNEKESNKANVRASRSNPVSSKLCSPTAGKSKRPKLTATDAEFPVDDEYECTLVASSFEQDETMVCSESFTDEEREQEKDPASERVLNCRTKAVSMLTEAGLLKVDVDAVPGIPASAEPAGGVLTCTEPISAEIFERDEQLRQRHPEKRSSDDCPGQVHTKKSKNNEHDRMIETNNVRTLVCIESSDPKIFDLSDEDLLCSECPEANPLHLALCAEDAETKTTRLSAGVKGLRCIEHLDTKLIDVPLKEQSAGSVLGKSIRNLAEGALSVHAATCTALTKKEKRPLFLSPIMHAQSEKVISDLEDSEGIADALNALHRRFDDLQGPDENISCNESFADENTGVDETLKDKSSNGRSRSTWPPLQDDGAVPKSHSQSISWEEPENDRALKLTDPAMCERKADRDETGKYTTLRKKRSSEYLSSRDVMIFDDSACRRTSKLGTSFSKSRREQIYPTPPEVCPEPVTWADETVNCPEDNEWDSLISELNPIAKMSSCNSDTEFEGPHCSQRDRNQTEERSLNEASPEKTSQAQSVGSNFTNEGTSGAALKKCKVSPVVLQSYCKENYNPNTANTSHAQSSSRSVEAVVALVLKEHGPQFAVGDVVDVQARTWPGIYKPGGVARITVVHQDGCYDVKYVLGSKESRVDPCYIQAVAKGGELSQSTQATVHHKKRRAPLAGSKASTKGHKIQMKSMLRTKTITSFWREKQNKTPKPCPVLQVRSATVYPGKERAKPPVFLTTAVHEQVNSRLQQVAAFCSGTIVPEFSNEVTHVITSTLKGSRVAAKRTLKYLHGVLRGKWIVSSEWVTGCLCAGKLLSEDQFEVSGDLKAKIPDAPRRSRLIWERQSDTSTCALFKDCIFYLHGEFNPPKPSRLDLELLIVSGGGNVAESIAQFNGKPSSKSIAICNGSESTFELKQFRAQEKGNAVNASVFQIVDSDWLVDSISNYRQMPFN